MEKKVTYFEKPGRVNTGACVSIVKDAVGAGVSEQVVAASTAGDTGLLLAQALKDGKAHLTVITHSAGFKEPNHIEMPADVRERIKALGADVYTGTMITHSLDTAFANKFGGSYLSQIVANSLRRFGEGTKVACECVMMAVDAGLVPEGEEVISIAGTARGADTVLLVKSAASKRFLDLRVLEVLAKPRV